MTTSDNVNNTGNPINTEFVTGTPATSGDAEAILTNSGYEQLGGLTSTDDNGMLAVTEPNEGGPRTVHPPAGTGAAVVYQPFGAEGPDSGFAFNLAVIQLSGLQNTSNEKYTLALPSPFQYNYMIWTAQCPTIELLYKGQPQTCNRAAGIGSMQTVQALGQFDWASGIGAVDSIRFGANDPLVSNGVIVLMGI